MSCSLCSRRYGMGRKKRECDSCKSQICSKCSKNFDGRDLGWIKPRITCNNCIKSLQVMLLRMTSPRTQPEADEQKQEEQKPKKQSAPSRPAKDKEDQQQKQKTESVDQSASKVDQHKEDTGTTAVQDDAADAAKGSKEVGETVQQQWNKQNADDTNGVPSLQLSGAFDEGTQTTAADPQRGHRDSDARCCELCTNVYDEADHEEVICSECASAVCARCAPTFQLSSVGEAFARRVCKTCFPSIESQVRKSPRVIVNQSCPRCSVEYDNVNHGKRECSECHGDSCATCAPRYRLVSLGETRSRRICPECLPAVKQQVQISKSPRALSPRILSPREEPPSTNDEPAATNVGAFGLRLRTGTVLKGLPPPNMQSKKDDAKEAEEAMDGTKVADDNGVKIHIGDKGQPAAKEKTSATATTVQDGDNKDVGGDDEDSSSTISSSSEIENAAAEAKVVSSEDSSSEDNQQKQGSVTASAPENKQSADVLRSSKGLFQVGGHRGVNKKPPALLNRVSALANTDDDGGDHSFRNPRRDTLSTPLQISDEEDSSSLESED